MTEKPLDTRANALYRGEFELDFQPMSSELPDRDLIFGELSSVVDRARRCLKGRSDNQVRTVALLSDVWAGYGIVTGRFELRNPDGSARVAEIAEAGSFEIWPLLRYVSDRICEETEKHGGQFSFPVRMDDQEYASIPLLVPRDIWAAQALVLYAQAVYASEDEDDDERTASIAYCAMRAVQCVTTAELGSPIIRPTADTYAVQISDSNKRAAEARWSKLQPVRDFAIRAYREGEIRWKSRAQGVRSIAPKVLAEAERNGIRLKEQNAFETITKWLKSANLPRK